MASLHQRTNGRFRISYYFGGRRFFASLKTKLERDATLTMHRLEENLQDLERGRLVLPDGADLSRFLLSDGRILSKPVLKKSISLKDLFARYEKEVPEGIKENNTRNMERIHMRRLLKELGTSLTTEKSPEKCFKSTSRPEAAIKEGEETSSVTSPSRKN
jgi:hypothetical protein